MFGWDYNEKILKQNLLSHAEDMGRLCAELLYSSPKAYVDFMTGWYKAIMEKELGTRDRRRPTEEGVNPDGTGK
jgi:hypothetical protein